MKSFVFTTIIFSTLFIIQCKPGSEKKPDKNILVSADQMVRVNKYLVERDKELIDAYIKRRNWNMHETESGLYYMICNQGKGKKSENGKTAEIAYSLELLDGTQCYSSDSLGTKKFVIGKRQVEKGLDEGILLMKENDKASFIMPSHLAYHLPGDEKCIPARAIIVYNVELLKISDN